MLLSILWLLGSTLVLSEQPKLESSQNVSYSKAEKCVILIEKALVTADATDCKPDAGKFDNYKFFGNDKFEKLCEFTFPGLLQKNGDKLASMKPAKDACAMKGAKGKSYKTVA